jgi:hypothetical protein
MLRSKRAGGAGVQIHHNIDSRPVDSQAIEQLLYHNHEMPCLGKQHSESEAYKLALITANMFDRVTLVNGWVLRLVGERRVRGGIAVDPPVLSRPYQLLADGHQAFAGCKKIRDTPFPFPYAQLMMVLLWLLAVSLPFVITYFVPAGPVGERSRVTHGSGKWPARIIGFGVVLMYFALNEVARELEVPFHVADNDLNIEQFHDEFITMLESLHVNFSQSNAKDFHPDLSTQVVGQHQHRPAARYECSCVVCSKQKQAEGDEIVFSAQEKGKMLFDTTEAEEENAFEGKKGTLTSLNKEWHAMRARQDSNEGQQRYNSLLHQLQSLRIAELKRASRLTLSEKHELFCLDLARCLRNAYMQPLADEAGAADDAETGKAEELIQEIDAWLLLEARSKQLDAWEEGHSYTVPSTSSQLPTCSSPHMLEVTKSLPTSPSGLKSGKWELTKIDEWEKLLEQQLKHQRSSNGSVIRRRNGIHEGKPQERENLELLRLWQHVLTEKKRILTPLDAREEDWLDHATIFAHEPLIMTANSRSESLSCVNDEDALKSIIAMKMYGGSAGAADSEHERWLLRIRLHILDRPRDHYGTAVPPDDGRVAKLIDSVKLKALRLRVLEQQRNDYRRMDELRHKLAQPQPSVSSNATSGESPGLHKAADGIVQLRQQKQMADREQEQKELEKLQNIQPPLKELTPSEEEMWRTLTLEKFARQVRGGTSDTASGSRRIIAEEMQFNEQKKFREVLRLKQEKTDLSSDEQAWFDQLRLIILKLHVEKGLLTEDPSTASKQGSWQDYEDLWLQELEHKGTSGTLKEQATANELQVQKLRRQKPDLKSLTLDEIRELKRLLTDRKDKFTLKSGETKDFQEKIFDAASNRRREAGLRAWFQRADEAQLEWLEQKDLEARVKDLEARGQPDAQLQVELEIKTIKVLERRERAGGEWTDSDQRELQTLREKERERQAKVNDKRLQESVVHGKQVLSELTSANALTDEPLRWTAVQRRQVESAMEALLTIEREGGFAESQEVLLEKLRLLVLQLQRGFDITQPMAAAASEVLTEAAQGSETVEKAELRDRERRWRKVLQHSRDRALQRLTDAKTKLASSGVEETDGSLSDGGRSRYIAEAMAEDSQTRAELVLLEKVLSFDSLCFEQVAVLAADGQLVRSPSSSSAEPRAGGEGDGLLPLPENGEWSALEAHLNATISGIEPALDWLKLKDLRRQQTNGLLESAEQRHELDVLTKSCLEQARRRRQLTSEEDGCLAGALLRLLERKAERGNLTKRERADLEVKRWQALDAKLRQAGELNQVERRKYYRPRGGLHDDHKKNFWID